MPPLTGLTSFVAGLISFATKLVSPVMKLVGFIVGLIGFATKLVGPVTKLVSFIEGLIGFTTKVVSPIIKLVGPIIKYKGFTLNFLTQIINNMNKVIIDISHKTDEEISATVGAAIAGITGNSSFTMVAPLAALVAAKTAYDPALAACAHGNEADTDLKNTKKGLLVNAYRVVAVQVNVQAAGDRVKALGSGCELEKDGSHQVMGEVINFKVETGSVAGYIDFSADKPKTFTTHGTIFAYWDPALGPTPADKNKWFQRHSNGSSLTIAGFTPGVSYPFAAAYKGLDTDVLLWTATMNKMAGD